MYNVVYNYVHNEITTKRVSDFQIEEKKLNLLEKMGGILK